MSIHQPWGATKLTTAIIGGALTLSTLAACGGDSKDDSKASTTAKNTASKTTASKTNSGKSSDGDTVTIKDAQGREVKIPKNPKKVVAMDFSVLRTLNDFGVDVAGTAAPLAIPADLKKYEDKKYVVGSVFEPKYETIAALKPDLVIIGGRSGKPEIVKEMLKITPNVIDMSVRPKDPKDRKKVIFERINQLASIFGKESEAKTKLDKIEKDMEKLNADVKKAGLKTVMVQVTGAKVSAYGPGSRFGFVWDEMGFDKISAPVDGKGSHGQEISQELFVKYDPDAIMYLDRGKTIGRPGKPAMEVLNSKLVNKTKAAKNQRIAEVDGFSWYIATAAPSSIEQQIADARKVLEGSGGGAKSTSTSTSTGKPKETSTSTSKPKKTSTSTSKPTKTSTNS